MFFLAKLKSAWYSFVFPFVLIFLSLLCEGCGGGGGGGGGGGVISSMFPSSNKQ